MSWIPIGPDFIFDPRNTEYRRLSPRNEWGTQGTVTDIGIDPTEQRTLYTVSRPWSGGAAAFVTRNSGATWVPISDDVQLRNPGADASCVAVNPRWPEYIYLGTHNDSAVYVSNDRGRAGTWVSRGAAGGFVRKIVVDARRAATVDETIVYAATQNGVFRSIDNGRTWPSTPILAGNITSLAAHLPATGTDHFYAGLWVQGVRYTNEPTGEWTDLSTGAPLLPTPAPVPEFPFSRFDLVTVAFTPRNPTRAYVWLFGWRVPPGEGGRAVTVGLYTTDSPRTSWTEVTISRGADGNTFPRPYQGLYSAVFAVAPHSPGDGVNDILFFGEWPLYRSVNGGRDWLHDRGLVLQRQTRHRLLSARRA